MNDFLTGIGLVAQVFVFASLVALVIERLVEKLVKPRLPASWSWASAYVALVLGAAFSAGFGIDLFTPVATSIGLHPFVPWVGYLLTGLAVGGGSNFLHDIWPAKTPTLQVEAVKWPDNGSRD